ncbi:histone deacetylase family protein [Sphingosinicella microcystinivorans]|uniref:histone deacetylase family protein n=1 Tax=Sphingosinicella microcystinivorans TaxID=335406 RepID=UPI0022F40659|nr:histone deacetylase family protein [Sphingosinicella microcystinivorans]WBX82756.1 histone deacetylase family protein [Sphingosinicella microcystinivorans]
MIFFFDERQLRHTPLRELHNGAWTPYAECADRALGIREALGIPAPARDFGMAPIEAVHDADYLAFLKGAHAAWLAAGREGDAIGYTWPVVHRRKLRLDRIDARLGRYSFDASTPIAEGSWEGAYWSAQTALTALDTVLAGAPTAFALCRPPGHHAGADYLGGYCYLNNAAITAQRAHDARAGPVAILDVDYHHGNGTQDIFEARGDIFFASLHADPATDYPYYWGHADETGTGEGKGATLNIPMPRGTRIDAYLAALDTAAARITAWGARFLVVSFGADTFSGDPISHFAIETEDFAAIGARIAAMGLPTAIIMEGGYAVGDLGGNVARFLSGFPE